MRKTEDGAYTLEIQVWTDLDVTLVEEFEGMIRKLIQDYWGIYCITQMGSIGHMRRHPDQIADLCQFSPSHLASASIALQVRRALSISALTGVEENFTITTRVVGLIQIFCPFTPIAKKEP